jgi:hypothetical protein
VKDKSEQQKMRAVEKLPDVAEEKIKKNFADDDWETKDLCEMILIKERSCMHQNKQRQRHQWCRLA